MTLKLLASDQTSGEILVRVIHIVIGLCLLGVAAWFWLAVPLFNPYGFFGFLVAGAIPFLAALFGSRKTIFQLLLFGWV
ncbi:hypothetical protein [Azonexus sp.]|jgi:hypothetical protein|uniref:hypothetical protein n=1 Tax=Azonexus sp. TaxID=1872668 RepID=UPI0028343D78|nr:hypothetical protein [Azonexus sp.]MDR1995995.1 hypothetical protein [Azonexus sp.]